MGASFDSLTPLPGPFEFDRDTVEVMLRRAIEVSDNSPLVIGHESGLGADELCDIAAQIGVPARAVAVAVAEHRVHASVTSGLIDRLVGPRILTELRSSSVDETEARAQLRRWLESGHGLRARNRPDGLVVATQRRDLVGRVGVGVRRSQGLGGLGRVRGVNGTVVEVDHEPPVICLAVDVGNKRNGAIAVGSVLAGAGVGVLGVTALLTGPLTLVGLPVVAAGGLLFSRVSHRSTVRTVTEDLTFTLDGIAHGHPPPTLIRRLGDRLRR